MVPDTVLRRSLRVQTEAQGSPSVCTQTIARLSSPMKRPVKAGAGFAQKPPLKCEAARCRQNRGRREYPPTDPSGIVTVGGIQYALISPFLATMRNGQKPWQEADGPAHTITGGGAGLTLVARVLTYAQQGGGNCSAEGPHQSVCAS